MTTTGIKEYIAERQEDGASNGTINRELSALKRMFTLGAESIPPKVLHVPKISVLRENNVRTGYFEIEKHLKLRNKLPDYPKPSLTKGYDMGMRKEEILSFTRKQVSVFDKTIILGAGTTKNDESRVIYLTGELYDTILSLKNARGMNRPRCQYVF
jgi:site-specific recombinase XerD